MKIKDAIKIGEIMEYTKNGLYISQKEEHLLCFFNTNGNIINLIPNTEENISFEFNKDLQFVLTDLTGLYCYTITKIYDKTFKCIWDREKDIEEEVDWSKVPIDTKILVKDFEDSEWVYRYFAGLDETGNVTAFYNGNTSWSANDMVSRWECAKLYKEGE